MKKSYCTACNKPFLSFEVQTYSSIYGTENMYGQHAVLCAKCLNVEEILIAEAGTNDLPDVREQYSNNIYLQKEAECIIPAGTSLLGFLRGQR